MAPKQTGFHALSTAYLDDFAVLAKLAEVLMLLNCIWEVLVLNLSQDCHLYDFTQSLQADVCRILI
jgi:hypothetical protein